MQVKNKWKIILNPPLKLQNLKEVRIEKKIIIGIFPVVYNKVRKVVKER